MNPYTVEVSLHLNGLRRADRAAALADLEDLLASGVTPKELGTPQEYANQLCRELGHPRRRLPGGLFPDREARAQLWAPQNPRLFVPRAVGLGWRLNIGQLAVRLGWLRPDDADADVIAAIPWSIRRGQRLAPVMLAGLSAVAAVAAWRTNVRVPINFDFAGRVNRWADRRWLVVAVAINGAIAGWGARTPDVPDEDAVVRPALATSAGVLTLALLLTMLAGARAPEAKRPWVAPVVLLVPVTAELTAIVLPLRAGLARVGQERNR